MDFFVRSIQFMVLIEKKRFEKQKGEENDPVSFATHLKNFDFIRRFTPLSLRGIKEERSSLRSV